MNENYEAAAGRLQYTKGVGAAVSPQKFNPEFVSQFDLNIIVKYYDVYLSASNETSYPWIFQTATTLTPAMLQPQFQTKMAFFLFGMSDRLSSYANASKLLPVNNWRYHKTMAVDTDQPNYVMNDEPPNKRRGFTFISPSYYSGDAKRGDVIISYYDLDSDGLDMNVTLCEIIVNCKQVQYTSLLEASSSDKFTINNVRYRVPTGFGKQYENQILATRHSLFGKLATDEVSPAAYQKPNQFQNEIVDIPIIKGIDKETSISSYLEYDIGEILLSIFVSNQTKV